MRESQHTQWMDLMERARRENWPLLPSPPDERDWPLSRLLEQTSVPPVVRYDHLVPFIPDQGKCGSCVGQAGANILNTFFNSKGKLPDKGLSPLYIYARCKEEDGLPGVEGTFPRVALKVMQQEGACPEVMLPYPQLLGNCLKIPTITDAHKKAAEPYRIKAYARLWSLAEVKLALSAGKLVLAGIWVTESFAKWAGKGTIGLPDGAIYGGHGVMLCGHDDPKKGVIGPNSWGAGWGDKGFFWLSYDFCNWKNLDLGGMPALMEAWAVELEQLPIAQTEELIELWVDKPVARVNGVEVWLDVPPRVINGRTLVPIRFVSESQGAQVDYIVSERKIEIRRKN